jgi:hypothetical protein
MFTTPTLTPVGGFIDEVSKIRAGWLNYVSNNFPNALDAIGGGYYQFTAAIRLSSDTAQVKINAPAVADPIALLGYVTIGVSDDVNYPVGVGTLTVSSAATFSAAVTFSSTVQFNGAQTFNAAVTFTSNGDITLQSGCAVTGQSGSSLTMQSGATTTLAGTNTLSGATTISGATTLSNITSATITNSASVDLTTPRSYTRTIDHPPLYDTANWLPTLDAESLLPIFASQSIAAGTTEIVWAWRPPSGATVTEVSVYLTPDTSPTHGGVPSVVLAVAKLVRNAVSAANTASQTDSSGDVATYETPHDLEITGLSMTFSEGDLLLIRLSPETGANAETNLKVAPPIVTFTRALIGEE